MPVTVTPSNVWPNAKFASVRNGMQPRQYVPIEQILTAPARLTIYRSVYPNGVVFLNECPMPNNADPIQLAEVTTNGTQIQVDIVDDAGWPSGKVVLFLD